MKILEFTILETLYQGNKNTIYRAEDNTNQPVILKLLKAEYPSDSELNQFKYEYQILKKFTGVQGIVQAVGFEKYHNSYLMMFRDSKSESLDSKSFYKIPLYTFYKIAKSTLIALDRIHEKKVIHKDIKPSNILYNFSTGKAEIIDFGSCVETESEFSYSELKGNMEGSLLYISPEQTGRVNRRIDYRTDYYSLGATFYQLLTGRPPFVASDSMDIVYHHIAKDPLPPHEFERGIPEAVSKIILKLLAKNPFERYQSAYGIIQDLEWLNSAQFDKAKFILGKTDFSLEFHLPEKLYGRQAEIQSLLETFHSVYKNGRPEISVITGIAGIGKSALVKELYNPISSARGYFISGEYEQFTRSLPLNGIIKAFSVLIRILLTENSDEIENWKNRILSQLGNNAQVIIDVLPELEVIIGVQPQVAELEPYENSNRFYLVFQNFIRTFCNLSHPLVLFLDDLQWADNASIQLIHNLLSDRSLKYFFIILSFRLNEDRKNEPIIEMLDALKKEKIYPRTIRLTELNLYNVRLFLMDCLNSTKEEIEDLANIIFSKTGGNPYFIKELLKDLTDEKKIFPDHESGKWKWDINEIQSIQISANIIELLVSKIQKLSIESQLTLMNAACIGYRFDLWTLSVILKQSLDNILKVLKELLRQDFLLVSESSIQTLNQFSDPPLSVEQAKQIFYQFQHDRIQQTAYELLPKKERESIQLEIGRIWLQENFSEENLFDIVSHLNAGSNKIADLNEKKKLIELNLRASKKAKLSTAYEPALQYVNQSLKIVSEFNEPWKEINALTTEVYRELNELYFLNVQFDELEENVALFLANTSDLSEVAHAYKLLIDYYTTISDYEKAISSGRKALLLFGVTLPDKSDNLSLEREFKKIKKHLKVRSVQSLFSTPENKNKEHELALGILSTLMPSAYLNYSELWIFLVLKSVNLLLTFGNSQQIFGYSCYGIISVSMLRDYKTGYEFGLLALELAEKFQNKSEVTKAANVLANYIFPFHEHLRNASAINRKCIDAGKESGELQHISYSLIFNALNAFYMGTNLFSVLNEIIPKHMLLCKQAKSSLGIDTLNALRIVLLGMTVGPDDKMESEVITEYEKKFLVEWKQNNNFFTVFIYKTLKIGRLYLIGSFSEAIVLIEKAKEFFKYVIGLYLLSEFNFYESLVLCALLPKANLDLTIEYKNRIKLNQKQMKEWAKACPENFQHKFLLVEAELAKIQGNFWKASKLYESSIEDAHKNEFLQNEAIANELCANAYFEMGKIKLMRTFQMEAEYLYGRWGAVEKTSQFEIKQKDILANPNFKNTFSFNKESSNKLITQSESSVNFSVKLLDLNTVLKAVQAIAEEIVIEKLMRKVLKILFENAGAEIGLFIAIKNGEFVILAKGNSRTDEIETFNANNSTEFILANSNLVPLSIINYVGRIKQHIVIEDAEKEELFINDRYLRIKHPKSILCYPVLRHEELIGIIYLENNFTTNAFTGDRLEIINILSTQIAISIENSELYSNLETKVEERTANLNQALQQVKTLKEKQDGDYFLTSLLIHPLGKNNIQSDSVRIEFLIEQRKKFLFKNKEVEIGGDLCTADRIFLNNRAYIVILNADAMGKSIQGAGGILVLGSVFKSILQRSYSESSDNNLFPEKWIKNSFLEMQRIFESFDGYMLISLVLGLLDEESGAFFFINVEHPRTILYRNQKAAFIEKDERKFRKMGIQGITSSINVSLFQMQFGDVLILGSDGRDDIILGKDEYGLDILNFDETLFLNLVEEGKGKLNDIYSRLTESAELNDDLSLLRLSFKEFESKTDLDVEKEVLQTELILTKLKLEIVIHSQNKDYLSLLKTYEALIELQPLETDHIVSISIVLFKIKNYFRFAEYSELIKLRTPENNKNTLRLIISYIRMKNYQRAARLLNEITLNDKENKIAEILEQILSDLIIKSL